MNILSNAPVRLLQAGLSSPASVIDKNILPLTFKATKDIRDKYVLSRLVWDLGIEDEISKYIEINL